MQDALRFSFPRLKTLNHFALLSAACLVALVAIRWYAYQWDFHMFYEAAVDFAAGADPYRGYGLSFYHPPVMLYVYGLFTFMPVPLACTVWYALKLLALVALILGWNKHILKLQADWPTVLFFLLAYEGAIYADLVAGNVSTFEELALWTGFALLLRNQFGLCCLCLIAAAQIKLTPILFSVLFLVIPRRPQWGWCVACVFGFTAVFSLNYWLQPVLLAKFFAVSATLDERGVQCTSMLALVRDILEQFFGAQAAAKTRVDEVTFLGLGAAITLQSWLAIRAYRERVKDLDGKLLICFCCVVFALISPRFKAYTYILLLVPTLYVMRLSWRSTLVPSTVFVVLTLTTLPQASSLLPIRYAFKLFNDYLPLVATFAVWVVYLGYMRTCSELREQPLSDLPTSAGPPDEASPRERFPAAIVS